MPYCSKCGGPTEGKCPRCREKLAFDRARGAFLYEGIVREIISLFKYQGQRKLSDLLAPYLLKPLSELGKPDFIVPLPLHPAKRRKRGFSQTEFLARSLSKLSGLPVRAPLIRVKNTKPQVKLPVEERKNNVRGAFALRGKEEIKGKNILLIDDVMTTGYTLSEAARLLKRSGASPVYALVVAIGSMR